MRVDLSVGMSERVSECEGEVRSESECECEREREPV